MRLNYIKITGYRGFDNFLIKSSDLSGLTILAGQNGTGKSTILEIVAYLLNSSDISQIYDINIFQGITKNTAEWEVNLSISKEEIDFIVRVIREEHPMYSGAKARIKKMILDDLKKEKTSYAFKLHLLLKKDSYKESSIDYMRTEPQFIGKEKVAKPIPQWLKLLQQKQFPLALYINPFENIGNPTSTYLSSKLYDPELIKMSNINIDIRNRNFKTNTDIGRFLKSVAMNDIYEVFQKNNGKFLGLNRSLQEINDLIKPLKLLFDEDDAKKGQLLIVMENTKTKKRYPLQFASSGERQVIGYASLLLNWKLQSFKPIILMDEPETHLHSLYVTRLAKFIKDTLDSEKNSTCMVATHSADFISQNSENIYQITPSSSSIEKVKTYKGRQELFESLGIKPDLIYLTPKIIFVEGSTDKKKSLSDTYIYQELIDPIQEKIVFIPANSRGEVSVATNFVELFLKELSKQNKTLKIFAIVDSDNKYINKKSKVIYTTPFNCVENLFLMDSIAISRAINLQTNSGITPHEVNSLVKKEIIKQGGGGLTRADGKKVFESLKHQLVKKYPNINKKILEKDILAQVDIARLPKSIQKFLKKIKTL